MKIFFNSLGVVTDFQVESTDSLRQGTVGNRLVAIFENLSISNYIPTLSFTRSDGAKISNVGMDITGANQCEVKFDDPWYFALDGEATMTVFLHDGAGNIVAQGQHRITIESTDYDPSAVPPINLEQYDYLLEQIAKRINKNGETELGASMDWTAFGGHSVFNYTRGQSLADAKFEFYVPVSFTSSIDAESITIRGDDVATKDFVTSETDKYIKKQGTTRIGTMLWLDGNSRAVLAYNSVTNLLKFVANLEATNINLTDGSITSNDTLYLGGSKLRAETSDTAIYMEDYFQLGTGGEIKFISDGAFTWNGNPVATTTYVTEQISSSLVGYATENYVRQQIAAAVTNAYKWSGSKTVAELNALTVTAEMHGYVFNVTDEGILNQGNVQVLAGDNVAIVWDSQNLTYSWDKLAGTFTVDLSNYYTKSESDNKYQRAVALVTNATTNASGREFVNYTASLTTVGGYTVYKIQKNGENLTEADAAEYMEYMTGSNYVPKYSYDFPKIALFVFADLSLWKPQFDNVNGLLLYKLNSGLVDLDSNQAIGGEKTFAIDKLRLKSQGSNLWKITGHSTYNELRFYNNSSFHFGMSPTAFYGFGGNKNLGTSGLPFVEGFIGKITDANGSYSSDNVFNVINASDIVSNTLTQAQYDLITNGKPTLIKGTFLTYENPWLFAPKADSTYMNGIIVGTKTSATQSIQGYAIHTVSKVISLYSVQKMIVDNIRTLNGKDIPAYPSSPTVPQVLVYDTDNTLKYKPRSNEWDGSQAEYDALRLNDEIDENTLYFIEEEEEE